MANEEHVEVVWKGKKAINEYRETRPGVKLDLSVANLVDANLSDAKVLVADLSGANLFRADLRGAKVLGAKLIDANLSGAMLRGANLFSADLSGAEVSSRQWIESPEHLKAWTVVESQENGKTVLRLQRAEEPKPVDN